MTKFKEVNHVHFVVVGSFLETVNRGGSVALQLGYTDHSGKVAKNKGDYVEYVMSRDEKGKNKAKRFRFDSSFRRLLTRLTDTDINQVSQYDFLKNHPGSEGSPNGTYDSKGNQTGVVFRELNSAKDATVALQSDRQRNEALTSAFNLEEETLTEVANIIGYYGEPDDLMKLKVVEFAGKRPAEYTELLNSGDRSLRALLRKALSEDIFTRKGALIMWEQTVVGSNEDDAIATLHRDKEMYDALKNKLDIDAPKPKGGPGRGRKKTVKEST